MPVKMRHLPPIDDGDRKASFFKTVQSKLVLEVGMSMNIVSLVRASLLGLALMLANTSPAGGQAQPAGGQAQPAGGQAQRTLYERLGGYNGISAVVDDFEDRLFVDPKVGRYFVGMGTDTREMFKTKNQEPGVQCYRRPMQSDQPFGEDDARRARDHRRRI